MSANERSVALVRRVGILGYGRRAFLFLLRRGSGFVCYFFYYEWTADQQWHVNVLEALCMESEATCMESTTLYIYI